MPEKSTKNFNSTKLSLATFGALFGLTALSGITLTNLNASADGTTKTDTVSVSIPAACTMITNDNTYNVTLNPGQESSDIGPSNIKVVCNDYNGYSIYAIGYSGNSYTGDNHTKLIGTNGTISTGTSGDNSWWAMKVNAVSGTYAPSIENGYDSYSVIPSTFTQVAKLTNATDGGDSATGSNMQAYYKVKASVSQIADNYEGKVKYTLVHPNNAPAPTIPPDMQTFTLAQCQTNAADHDYVVRDARDGSEYTVRYINNQCWMTQNLRITHSTGQPEGTILGSGSNFSATSITFDGDLTEGSDYTKAYYHVPTPDLEDTDGNKPMDTYTADQLGVWYNFCAASAKDTTNHGCDNSDLYSGTEDICPANWRLPNDTGNTTGGEMYDLATALTGNPSLFSPIYGGHFNGSGALSNATTNGYWWSSTAYSSTFNYHLRYRENTIDTQWSKRNKSYGFYLRCILDTE